jgi:molybdenum cofactor synthesis domain-containing protein
VFEQGYLMSNPSAAILVIGDEVLSGRTLDTNSNYIARQLGVRGIDVRQIRVVGDVEDEIVAALNALRVTHGFVFTTGGIGPTHDDITADAIAKAFGLGIGFHPEAWAMLEARYAQGEFNTMRQRMARVPDGATLIPNSVSVAPGFHIGNVFVMAGVPMVMRAMMEAILPGLPQGAVMQSVTLSVRIPEGRLAQGLADVQAAHPAVAIGSYPFYDETGPGTQLVARGRDRAAVEQAAQAIEAMLLELGASAQRLA